MSPPEASTSAADPRLTALFQPGRGVPFTDPLLKPLGRLAAPPDRLAMTRAVHRFLNGDASPASLCLLFQRGKCRAGEACNQLHVDPEWVAHTRHLLATAPGSSCCPWHGDLPSRRPDFQRLLAGVELTLTEGPGMVVTVPACRVALTAFWDQFLSSCVDTSAGTLRFHADRVCRLHQQNACQFGVDCNNLHLCRDFWGAHGSPGPEAQPGPEPALRPEPETPPAAPQATSPQSGASDLPLGVGRLSAILRLSRCPSSSSSLGGSSSDDPSPPRRGQAVPEQSPATAAPPHSSAAVWVTVGLSPVPLTEWFSTAPHPLATWASFRSPSPAPDTTSPPPTKPGSASCSLPPCAGPAARLPYLPAPCDSEAPPSPPLPPRPPRRSCPPAPPADTLTSARVLAVPLPELPKGLTRFTELPRSRLARRRAPRRPHPRPAAAALAAEELLPAALLAALDLP